MRENRTSYFYILLMGRFISEMGSCFNLIALNLFVLVKTGSPVITGLSLATRVLVASFSSPYLGSLSDRIDRKRGMIISDAVLAACMAGLFLFSSSSWIIPAIFVTQAALGIFGNFFTINFQAALPLLAPKGNLLRANSFLGIIGNLTTLVGSLGAALLIGQTGYRWAFFADGASYLVSLFILILLPVVTQERRVREVKPAGEGFMNGVNLLRKSVPFIFIILLVRWLDGIGSGSHNVAMPAFSETLMPSNPSLVYGLMMVAWSAGGIAGVALLNYSNIYKHLNLKRTFLYSTLLMSAFWIATFQSRMIGMVLFLAIIAGVFDTAASIFYSIILQRSDDAVRGRVMALSAITMTTGFGCSMALASLMTSFLSIPMLVAFWHGIPLITITFILLLLGKRRRHISLPSLAGCRVEEEGAR